MLKVIVSISVLILMAPAGLGAGSAAAAGVELTFSHPPGFYTEEFELTVESSDPDVQIRYTMNGNEPNAASPILHGPLGISSRNGDPDVYSMIRTTANDWAGWAPPQEEVFKATVVRVRAFRGGVPAGDTQTATYFVDPLGAERYRLPVISLVSDSVNWFGYEEGIYVLGRVFSEWRAENPEAGTDGSTPANWHGRGRDWERPLHIELFKEDGRLALATHAGVRTHGGWSRAIQQKSLRLYARSEYGDSRFRYPFFEEKPIDNFNRLILRNSGQDWPETMLRDAYMQRLISHLGLDYQAYLPVIVFLNGEYWGLYNVRERVDRHFLAANQHLDGDNIDLLTGNAEVKEGDDVYYLRMIDYLMTNGADEQEHYEHVKTLMDVDNFIDYVILQIFFRNTDWPHNNIDFWRYRAAYDPDARPALDGRWRWIVFDLDFGFGLSGRPFPAFHNTLSWATSPTGNNRGAWATFLLRALLENEEFRTAFVSRFADHLNTTFRTERMIDVLEEMQRAVAPEMPEHLLRWGAAHGWRPPADVNGWNAYLEIMRRFARQRPGYQWEHLMEFFDLPDTIAVRISQNDPGAGTVTVNSVPLEPATEGFDEFPWSGTYFEDVPVTISASPAAGYRFVEWRGSLTSSEPVLEVSPSEAANLTAVFELGGSTAAEPPAHPLRDGPYIFSHWDEGEPAGSYPANMRFFYMDEVEPGLGARPAGITAGAYDLDSRTRIVGLGDGGFAFINTSNLDGNPGYPGRRLGAAAVAVDTRGRQGISVEWRGGTVLPNSRAYNLRLQYRIGDEGPLYDVLDVQGNPVEYERSDQAGHSETLGPVRLPAIVDDRPYVQIWWRYYYTGFRESEDDGRRSMMHVSDVMIMAEREVSSDREEPDARMSFALEANYPNPFDETTTITFTLPEAGPAELAVYDILGRRVATAVDESRPAGRHTVEFDASGLSAGVYLYHLSAGDHAAAGVMQVVR